MSLRTLAGYSLGMANNSHRAPGTKGKQQRTAHLNVFEGGAAFTSSIEIRTAVTNLCGVKRVRTGKVTLMLDTIYDEKLDEAKTNREKKRDAVIQEQRRKDAVKGVKFNTAMTETMASDKETLEAHMDMLGNAKG